MDRADDDAALARVLREVDLDADPPLLLAVIKALVRRGHPGLAVHVLNGASRTRASNPNVAALHGQIASLPSGAIAWTAQASRYRANIEALNARGFGDGSDALSGTSRAAPPDASLAALEAYRTPSGNVVIVDRVTGADHDDAHHGHGRGRISFRMPLENHAREAMSLPLDRLPGGGAVLLVGLPGPAMIEHLLGHRRDDGFGRPVHVIETDQLLLHAWLHLIDIASAVRTGRLVIFAGDHAPERYADWRVAHLAQAPPAMVMTVPRPGWHPPAIDPSFRDRVARTVEQRKATLRAAQATYYDHMTPDAWTERYAQASPESRPLRIAGITTRYSTVIQHAMRHLGDAFERRGCRFDLVIEPDDASPIVDTWTPLARAPYDLVVTINHLRAELADRVHPRVPVVSWIQDQMEALWTRDAGRSVGPLDLVICRAPMLMETLYDYPRGHLLGSSNLTAVDACGPRSTGSSVPRVDLSYVGHGWQTAAQLVAGLAPDPASDRRRCLDLVREAIESSMDVHPWMTVRGRLVVLSESIALLDSDTRDRISGDPSTRAWLVAATERVYDRVFRQQALSWCAEWARRHDRSFAIYGRGWPRHAELAEFARGEAVGAEALRAVYAASAIGLQINGYDSLHPRLLDGLAEGTLMLVRHNPADFTDRVMARIAAWMTARSVGDLEDLDARRGHDAGLAAAMDEAERLTGLHLRPMSDPGRRRDVELLSRFDVLPSAYRRDDGLASLLAGGMHFAERVAGAIDGIDDLVFDSRASLHEMLDRLVDDGPRRERLVAPARRSVLRHDTYDVLVDRMLRQLTDVFRGAGDASPIVEVPPHAWSPPIIDDPASSVTVDA